MSTRPIHPNPDCGECNAYLARRATALPPHVARYAKARGMRALDLAVEFMRGVHRRHMAGLSLATPTHHERGDQRGEVRGG